LPGCVVEAPAAALFFRLLCPRAVSFLLGVVAMERSLAKLGLTRIVPIDAAEVHLVLALLIVAACSGPRDPEGTLERVRGGVLRVGVIEDPPFATFVGNEVAGVEPILVSELAKELNAQAAWVPGSASDLLESLERRELDLVVGGLTAATPYHSKVALTLPFYSDSLVVGVPPGGAPVTRLENREVSVEVGDAAAAYVRSRKAVPTYVRRLEEGKGLVAAPAWRLAWLGRLNSRIVLHQDRRVWALPRGENGWLVRVERFLRSRKARIPQMLREETAR
jgi:polar amino acid transport system substrate-binding protein